MEFLGDALGAIFSGGVTGLFGSVISIWGEYKKNQLLFAHKETMAVHNQESMKLEAELELKKIETESEAQQLVAEGQALVSSYGHDKATYYTGKLGKFGQILMVTVDFLRGIIRPVMTIYLVVLTTFIYWEVQNLVEGLDGVINKNLAVDLLQQIILIILYITTTVVLWWFGTRQKIINPNNSIGS